MAILDRDQLIAHLNDGVLPFISEVEVLSSIDSTNSHLLAQPIEFNKARLCLTEEQTKGRGRHGNTWASVANQNIMMSMSWGFEDWPDTITGLGLAVSLVVAERVNLEYSTDIKIKWPNDLMVDDAKIAGILVDVTGRAGEACNVVIGLGLNVHQTAQGEVSQDYLWQDLRTLGVVDVNRNSLAAKIASDWIYMLRRFSLDGFSPFVDAWNALSSFTDRVVKVTEGKEVTIGKMLGVDSNGGLIVLSNNGDQQVFNNNNVSVRLY